MSVREAMDQLYDALRADRELREDLALVPERVMWEAQVTSLLANLDRRWNIRDLTYAAYVVEISPDGTDKEVPHGEGVDVEIPEGREDDARVARAILRVIHEAFIKIQAAKEEDLDAIGSSNSQVFGRATTLWNVSSAASGHLALSNQWLVIDAEDPTHGNTVIAPGLLEVPVDAAHLTAVGRQRLIPDTAVWAEVFGKVEPGIEPLRVLPFAIFSA